MTQIRAKQVGGMGGALKGAMAKPKAVTIQKPGELTSATATIYVRKDAGGWAFAAFVRGQEIASGWTAGTKAEGFEEARSEVRRLGYQVYA